MVVCFFNINFNFHWNFIHQFRTDWVFDTAGNLVADYRNGPESEENWTALFYTNITL